MRNRKSLSMRILSVLEKDPRNDFNAPTIDRILCGEKNYRKSERKEEIHKIRTELRRMVKRGFIRNEKKGFYSLRITTKNIHMLENPPILVHGLKIETKIKYRATKSIESITDECNNLFKENEREELMGWLKSQKFQNITKGRWVKRKLWEGHVVTITVHPSCGLIEIWVQSTDNPLTFVDLMNLVNHLKGFFSVISDFEPAMVRQIGLNKDFKELRVTGMSSMSLHAFMNAFSQIYNKERIGVMRVETHWVGSISFQDALLMLASISLPPVEKKEDESRDEGVMFG